MKLTLDNQDSMDCRPVRLVKGMPTPKHLVGQMAAGKKKDEVGRLAMPAAETKNGQMFTGWRLTDGSRAAALEMFPPTHKEVVAHHITDLFGVAGDAPPPPPAKLRIVGQADRDGVQALAVEVNGTTERLDGGVYHLTVSHAEDRRSVDSNALLAAGWDRVAPLDIDGEGAVMLRSQAKGPAAPKQW